jgi:hypothetical protein
VKLPALRVCIDHSGEVCFSGSPENAARWYLDHYTRHPWRGTLVVTRFWEADDQWRPLAAIESQRWRMLLREMEATTIG